MTLEKFIENIPIFINDQLTTLTTSDAIIILLLVVIIAFLFLLICFIEDTTFIGQAMIFYGFFAIWYLVILGSGYFSFVEFSQPESERNVLVAIITGVLFGAGLVHTLLLLVNTLWINPRSLKSKDALPKNIDSGPKSYVSANLIPVEKYAAAKGAPKSEIVERLRSGVIEGRQEDGKWFVSETQKNKEWLLSES